MAFTSFYLKRNVSRTSVPGLGANEIAPPPCGMRSMSSAFRHFSPQRGPSMKRTSIIVGGPVTIRGQVHISTFVGWAVSAWRIHSFSASIGFRSSRHPFGGCVHKGGGCFTVNPPADVARGRRSRLCAAEKGLAQARQAFPQGLGDTICAPVAASALKHAAFRRQGQRAAFPIPLSLPTTCLITTTRPYEA